MKNKIKLESTIPHTIYTDVVGLNSPLLLGGTIHYYNYTDGALYMQIVGSSTSSYWSNHTVNLGSLGSGNSAYKNLDNFLSRAAPASALNETIDLTLNAYNDSDYTDLAHTFTRSVTVVFIKSTDGSWTSDFADNFDNASVMGWACAKIDTLDDNYMANITTSTSYATSPTRSLLSYEKGDLVQHAGHLGDGSWVQRIYKSFALPDRNTIYVIFNIRVSAEFAVGAGGYRQDPACATTRLNIYLNDITQLMQLGYAATSSLVNNIPRDRWLRIVFPVSSYKNTTAKLSIETVVYYTDGTPQVGDPSINIIYMDDFKIISK